MEDEIGTRLAVIMLYVGFVAGKGKEGGGVRAARSIDLVLRWQERIDTASLHIRAKMSGIVRNMSSYILEVNGG